METKEEQMQAVFNERRRSVLEDMSIRELLELVDDAYIVKDWLIDLIMENYWDKQINEEVR